MRDFRLLFSGRFKTRRPLSWSLGYMYDGLEDEWRFRQTGITIGFPKLHGNLFVGRTKEGYSLVKVMTGYHGWTMERSPSLEFVPSVAARGVGAIEVGGPIVRGKLGNFVAAGYCGSEDPPQNSRTTRRARQVLEV